MSAVSGNSSPRNVLSSNGKKYEMYYETKYEQWFWLHYYIFFFKYTTFYLFFITNNKIEHHFQK